MRDYTKDQATAKRIIEKYGVYGYVKLVRGSGTLDPVSGTITGSGEQIDVLGVDLSINKNILDSGTFSGQGLEIKATDRMVIMTSDVKPLSGDSVLIGGAEFNIIAILPLSPAGTDVFYKVICRG